MESVIRELSSKIGKQTPHLVTVDFTWEKSKAVLGLLEKGEKVFLGDLIKDPRARDKNLDLVIFVIKTGGEPLPLPPDDYQIKENDQLLFCGTALAGRLFNATINSEYKLHYIQNGEYPPRSYLMKWMIRKGLIKV